MSAVASWLARMLWGHMLWAMRRPWMKRLQRQSMNWFAEHKREGVRNSMIKQNRWARRVGRTLLTFALNMLLASIIITTTYFMILGLYEQGYFEPSEAMKR